MRRRAPFGGASGCVPAATLTAPAAWAGASAKLSLTVTSAVTWPAGAGWGAVAGRGVVSGARPSMPAA